MRKYGGEIRLTQVPPGHSLRSHVRRIASYLARPRPRRPGSQVESGKAFFMSRPDIRLSFQIS